MSEDFEDDECLDSVLKDFVNIKNTGTPCKVVEARKFYVNLLNESKNTVIKSLGLYLMNMNQPLPYSKLDKEELETVIDDGDFMIESITVFNNLLPLVQDLYKHPKEYNAWKGLLQEQVAYYIEAKSVEKSDKDAEGLYV